MKRKTKHIDIRFGDNAADQLIWEVIHRHEGYATMAAYVKAAIIDYDKQHRLRPEILAQTNEVVNQNEIGRNQESELDAILDILNK